MIKKDDKPRVSPKVKYKNIETGELKEGRLIGEPIRNGADTFVKVQVSGGSQGIILMNSKYVYPLFGECSDEEFNSVIKTMKEIENEKCKIMENDNSKESIKNDIQDDKLRCMVRIGGRILKTGSRGIKPRHSVTYWSTRRGSV